jgi:hypothetical protein
MLARVDSERVRNIYRPDRDNRIRIDRTLAQYLNGWVMP